MKKVKFPEKLIKLEFLVKKACPFIMFLSEYCIISLSKISHFPCLTNIFSQFAKFTDTKFPKSDRGLFPQKPEKKPSHTILWPYAVICA